MAGVAQGTSRKPYYAKKSDWADAQARELRAQASKLRFQSSQGQALRAMRKFEAVDNLNREAAKYERMAAAFRKKGI